MWKQHLYSFLLRRVLGPLLTPESNRKLNASLDVTEGRFVLSDAVELNAAYISQFTDGVEVLSAEIERLEIQLSLEEEEHGQSNSLAWRALQLATASPDDTASTTVALVAQVVVDGLCLQVKSCPSRKDESTPVAQPEEDEEETAKTQSVLSSYIAAALASLQLNVQLNNTRVRVVDEADHWVELRVQQITYQDGVVVDQTPQKRLDVTRVSIVAGQDESFTTVSLLDGTSRLSLALCKSDTGGGDEEVPLIRKEIRVEMEQRCNFSFCSRSLSNIKDVVQSFVDHMHSEGSDSNAMHEPPPSWILGSPDDDERDLATIDALVKQYQEARLLVERKEIRGGILVPATEESGLLTFDTFFDANEFNASKYSVHESIFIQDTTNTTPSDWVHTKFHFHLNEGGIKLSFHEDEQQTEYVLVTFGGLHVTSSISRESTDHELRLGHLDIENSHIVDDVGDGKNIEIGTLLRFKEDPMVQDVQSDSDGGDDDDDSFDGDVNDCVVLSIRTDHGDTEDATMAELTIQPIEVAYYMATADKVKHLIESVGHVEFPNGDDSGIVIAEECDPRTKSLSAIIACDFVELSVPLPSDNTDWSKLYERCGYTAGGSLMRKPCLGITFDRCHVECNRGSVQELALSCNNMIGFASAPKMHSVFDTRSTRVDIFGLCGRDEVEPHIPVYIQLKTGALEESELRGNFPRVIPISSFKTRQADEDDEATGELYHDVDNEPTLLSNVEAARSQVIVRIPEFIVDLTSSEVDVLRGMAEALSSNRKPSNENVQTRPSSSNVTSVSLDCNLLSLVVRGDGLADDSFAIITILDKMRFNCCLEGQSPNHVRFLVHEVDVHEGQWIQPLYHNVLTLSPFFKVDLCISDQQDSTGGCSATRVTALRDRALCFSDSVVKPLLHRSHLFSPISRETPALLIDVLFQLQDDLIEKVVHATLYDTTCRVDFDSLVLERSKALLAQLQPHKKEPQQHRSSSIETSPKSLTRFFLSLTDCNVDYTSSTRFKTASRLILRVGEFRASSNILSPGNGKQAGNLSIGDLSVHLCNQRFPPFFENGRVARSDTLMDPDQTGVACLGILNDTEPDEVWRAMNTRSVVTIDSASAAVVTNPSGSKEPPLCLTLVVGEITLLACKDSFALFNGSLGELSEELTALSGEQIEQLRALSSYKQEQTDTSEQGEEEPPTEESEQLATLYDPLDDLRKQSALKPALTPSPPPQVRRQPDFLLDGYDWTTIDADEMGQASIPVGEEQASRWYGDPSKKDGPNIIAKSTSDLSGSMTGSTEELATSGPNIVSHHFAFNPIADPLSAGDMGVAKLVGTTSASMKSRVIVKELSFKLRFFDGYDWPELLDSESRSRTPKDGPFIIPEVKPKNAEDEDPVESSSSHQESKKPNNTRKAQLMGELLQDEPLFSGTFLATPLPEERSRMLKEQAEMRRLARRTAKYFQVAATGVSCRIDSLDASRDHQLANCTNIKLRDFFLAETISGSRPVKMIGEWFNEEEHPRDSNAGLVMIKMVTHHPLCRVTPTKEVASDETEVSLQILPLRCLLDQRAISFARAFFSSSPETTTDAPQKQLPPGLFAIPPPLFTTFKVHPLKLKVDYWPQTLDSKALRDGAIVELINLNSIDGMVLTLQQVQVTNELGLGAVVSILVGRWVRDICSTQLLKFVTKARPLEPITQLSGAASDMVVLPWEAFRNGESIQKALRSGVKSLSKTVAYELLSVTSKAAQLLVVTGADVPSRPVHVPHTMVDAAPHAVESLTRGIQEANYKIVIIPYREYQRNGARGAARSIVKGIPVALAAPASGAAEALSYALVGARNQVRPDIRKEEEASIQGLHFDS